MALVFNNNYINYKFQIQMYLYRIISSWLLGSAEEQTTGRVIPSRTKCPPAQVSDTLNTFIMHKANMVKYELKTISEVLL